MVTSSGKTITERDLSGLAAHLRLVITRTARRLRQQAGTDLGPSQISALASIERHGPLTPSELAEIERIQRPSATRIVARLEEAGLMEPAGAAAVASAKESGMWTLMDPVEDLVVPDDLDAAFDVHVGSREHWESFSPSSRKQMLAWIVMAKRPETRAVRVLTTAAKAALGEKSQ